MLLFGKEHRVMVFKLATKHIVAESEKNVVAHNEMIDHVSLLLINQMTMKSVPHHFPGVAGSFAIAEVLRNLNGAGMHDYKLSHWDRIALLEFFQGEEY